MPSLGAINLLPMTSSQHGIIHNHFLFTTCSQKSKSDAQSIRFGVRVRAISPKPDDGSVNVASQSAASSTSFLSVLCPLLKFFGVNFKLLPVQFESQKTHNMSPDHYFQHEKKQTFIDLWTLRNNIRNLPIIINSTGFYDLSMVTISFSAKQKSMDIFLLIIKY